MADTSLAARLQDTHPRYAEFLRDWQFYADSYEGGETYTMNQAYLFRHTRETDKDYDDRLVRATYLNFIEKQVDIYTAFLFKDPISRTMQTADESFTAFEQDADRKGTPLSQLMANHVAKFGMILGHTVAVVDLPRITPQSRTRRQDTQQGVRPYVSVYTPLEVVDWSMDPDGNYRWLRVCEPVPDTADWNAARPEAKELYRVWTREDWFLYDDTGQQLDGGHHGLGEVPAVFIPILEHLRYMDVGQSLIATTSRINRQIYNYDSLLDEFLYRQAFNVLALPVDDSMTPEKVRAIAAAIGTQKGIHYPASGNPPSYVSPPSDPANVLMDRKDRAKKELIECAKLQDRSTNGSEKSGIAHKYEFLESNSAFTRIAQNLQDGEKKIIRLFYKWQQRDRSKPLDVPVTSTYPQDFSIQTLSDMIDEALALLQTNTAPTFNQLVRKRLVTQTFPQLEAEVKQAIDEEIETAPPDDILAREFAGTGTTPDGAATTTPSTTSAPDMAIPADLRLNGAQIQAAADVLRSVQDGHIAAAAATELLQQVGISAGDAQRMVSAQAKLPQPPPDLAVAA